MSSRGGGGKKKDNIKKTINVLLSKNNGQAMVAALGDLAARVVGQRVISAAPGLTYTVQEGVQLPTATQNDLFNRSMITHETRKYDAFSVLQAQGQARTPVARTAMITYIPIYVASQPCTITGLIFEGQFMVTMELGPSYESVFDNSIVQQNNAFVTVPVQATVFVADPGKNLSGSVNHPTPNLVVDSYDDPKKNMVSGTGHVSANLNFNTPFTFNFIPQNRRKLETGGALFVGLTSNDINVPIMFTGTITAFAITG
jgi:hypothetical protein